MYRGRIDAVTGCKNTPLAAGIDCADGRACNGPEICDGASACKAGTPLACDDGEPCTADSCNDASGCVHDGTAANGAVCQAPGCGGALCRDGACMPDAGFVCDDGNPCTADACGANGTCTAVPLAGGTDCSDADKCNGTEVCDGAGTCQPGLLVSCTGSDSCHVPGVCNKDTGLCSNPIAADSTACGNFDACHTGSCQTGVCSKGASKPDGAACDDNRACSASSSCQAGACASEAPTCRTTRQNDASSCDLSTGQCSSATAPCPPHLRIASGQYAGMPECRAVRPELCRPQLHQRRGWRQRFCLRFHGLLPDPLRHRGKRDQLQQHRARQLRS